MTEPPHIRPLVGEEVDRAALISRRLIEILAEDLRADPRVILVAMTHVAIEAAAVMARQGCCADGLRAVLKRILDQFDRRLGEAPAVHRGSPP